MKMLYLTLLLTCLTLLSGCNGSSGKNDDITGEPQIATSLTVVTLTSSGNRQQSFDKYETITLQATLLDESNNPISGTRVNFTIDLGSLSVPSALTNSDGIAVAKITNPEENLSAGTVSAETSDLNQVIDYEYVNNSPSNLIPTISTQLLLNGVPTNRFRADEQVQVVSTFVNTIGKSSADQIINLSADIGELSAVTALTSDEGIASVILLGSDLTPTTNIIGAGVITINLADDSAVNTRINYEIVPTDAIIDESIRLGYFDESNQFIEGKIKLSISNNTLSAGGTLGLTVDLVDSENNRVNTPTTITFTSNCVNNNRAVIDESVLSIKGRANATFADISCAGISGSEDIIIASVTTSSVTNTASETVTITGEQLGSIEFISAEPTEIVLKGTGGQGNQETSTLTFRVKSELGNVLAQQHVEFSLTTAVGGVTLSRESGLTNSQGLITTQVNAGTVPTVIRVSAISEMLVNGETITIQTQSDLLSINTGLPEQKAMTISASTFNPEAFNFSGETSIITARLADHNSNPVPDGTTVNFSAEGGHIPPSCNTVDGKCSVTWVSAESRPNDHRITILATAKGHETFYETNANGVFDNEDGMAIVDIGVSSGFERHSAEASGFIDMQEAWRDDNANNIKDANEVIWFDDNQDGKHSAADGLFNGPQCLGELCAIDTPLITLRKSLELVMSSSDADYILALSGGAIVYENSFGTSREIGNIGSGVSLELTFSFSDTTQQTLPEGTTVDIKLSNGELTGKTSMIVPNNKIPGYTTMKFAVTNPVDGVPSTETLTFTITTPKGIITSFEKDMSFL